MWKDYSEHSLLTKDTRFDTKVRPFDTGTAAFAITFAAGRHAKGQDHWQGDPEFSVMMDRRNKIYEKHERISEILAKPRSSKLKLKRNREPAVDDEAERASTDASTTDASARGEADRNSSSSSGYSNSMTSHGVRHKMLKEAEAADVRPY